MHFPKKANAPDSRCPAPDELRGLFDGNLGIEDADRVSEHLDACEHCRTTIESLEEIPDSLLSVLRKSHAEFEYQDEAITDPLFNDEATTSIGNAGGDKALSETLPSDQLGNTSQSNEDDFSVSTSSAASEISDIVANPKDRKYDVGELIAKGGMGAVINAKDHSIRRQVAMKVMLGEAHSQRGIVRFIEEAQITGQLEHPSIVPVHELGVNKEGNVFYTMKLVHGRTLKEILDAKKTGDHEVRQQFSQNRLLNHFLRACDAMAFAHARGVIHRDLKPSNIMIGDYGEVLVVDWGLAKVLNRDGTSDEPSDQPTEPLITAVNTDQREHTVHGTVMGTPAYMPPEQASGHVSELDERSDIYSLGAVLYCMLAFRPPVRANSAGELLEKIRSGHIDPLQNPDPTQLVPDSLAAVVMKALSRDKADRYQTVQDLQHEVEAYLNGFATQAEGASSWRQARLFVKRHKAVSIASMIAAVLLTVLGIGGPMAALRQASLKTEAVEAQTEAETATQIANEQRTAAETATQTANEQRQAALAAEARAAARAEDLRQQLYAFEMIAASIEATDPEGKPQIDRWIPDDTDEVDPRGWEWYYVASVIDQSHFVYPSSRSTPGFEFSTDGEHLLLLDGGPRITKLHRESGRIVQQWSTHSYSKMQSVEDIRPLLPEDSREFVFRHLEVVREAKSPAARKGNCGFAVSPDGTSYVVATPGVKHSCTLQCLGVDQNTVQWSLKRNGKPFGALAWSPDGSRVAFGASPMTNLTVVDAATGKQLASRTIPSGVVSIYRIAWSPDGKSLAFTTGEGEMHVVLASDLSPFPGWNVVVYDGSLGAIQWSPDGRRIACAGDDRVVRVWDVATSTLQLAFRGHQASIEHLSWSPDSRWIASGETGGGIRLWETTHDSRPLDVTEFSGKKSEVNCIEWHPSKRLFAIAISAGVFDSAVVLQWPSASVVLDPGHWDRSVAWSPSGKMLALGRLDGGSDAFYLREFPSGKIQWDNPPAAVQIAFSPNGDQIVGRDYRGIIAMRNASDGSVLWERTFPQYEPVPQRYPRQLVFHPEGTSIACGRKDGKISIMDPKNGSDQTLFEDHADVVMGLDWSPGGKRLASASADQTARIWDFETGTVAHELLGHSGLVRDVRWSPDGSRLATASTDGTVRLWNPTNGAETARYECLGPMRSVDWDPSGNLLIGGGEEGLRVWDATSGYRKTHLEMARTMAAASDWEPAAEHSRTAIENYPEDGQPTWFQTGWWFTSRKRDDPSLKSPPPITLFQEIHEDDSSWKRLDTPSDIRIELKAAFRNVRDVGLLATRVFSPKQQTVGVYVFGPGSFTLWHNRNQVIESKSVNTKQRGAIAEVELTEGWNTFVIQQVERVDADIMQFQIVKADEIADIRNEQLKQVIHSGDPTSTVDVSDWKGMSSLGDVVAADINQTGLISGLDIAARFASYQWQWSKPVELEFDSKMRTGDHLDPVISRDGGHLYVSLWNTNHMLDVRRFNFVDSGFQKLTGGTWLSGDIKSSRYDHTSSPLFGDGSMIFTSDRPGSIGGKDLWVCSSKPPAVLFTQAKPLAEPINSIHNDVDACVTSDGLGIVFGSDRPVPTAQENAGQSELWWSNRKTISDDFDNPRIVGMIGDQDDGEKVSVSTPCISSDGLLLIYAANQDNGTKDLYYRVRKRIDQDFGKRTRLDEVIQSPVDDIMPSLSSDGKTLIFASRQAMGNKKLRLFVTHLEQRVASR